MIELPDLDPDDTRPASRRIADILRAAILTKRMVPGERMPTQRQISERYGVARLTVERAMISLQQDGLVATKQGSGTYVRDRPVKSLLTDFWAPLGWHNNRPRHMPIALNAKGERLIGDKGAALWVCECGQGCPLAEALGKAYLTGYNSDHTS